MEDSFRNRETQFEAKFAHDEEIRFKILAHRNKLFAAWVVGELGAGAPDGYAETLTESAFGRPAAELVARAHRDLEQHGVATTDIALWKALGHCQDQSEHDVMTEVSQAG